MRRGTRRLRGLKPLHLALVAVALLLAIEVLVHAVDSGDGIRVVNVPRPRDHAASKPSPGVLAAAARRRRAGAAAPTTRPARSPASFTPPLRRPGTHARPVLKRGAAASFAQLLEQMPWPVDLAVAPIDASTVQILGRNLPAPGWSTTKVAVITAL